MYRTALSRILVVAVPRHALAARAFFVEGGGQATQDKLRAIMEEYRQAKWVYLYNRHRHIVLHLLVVYIMHAMDLFHSRIGNKIL